MLRNVILYLIPRESRTEFASKNLLLHAVEEGIPKLSIGTNPYMFKPKYNPSITTFTSSGIYTLVSNRKKKSCIWFTVSQILDIE